MIGFSLFFRHLDTKTLDWQMNSQSPLKVNTYFKAAAEREAGYSTAAYSIHTCLFGVAAAAKKQPL